MDDYKCARCGKPAPLLDDGWECQACGCITLERVRRRPALIDPATVSAQLVAMSEGLLRSEGESPCPTVRPARPANGT